MRKHYGSLLTLILLMGTATGHAQKSSISFIVSMDQPATHNFHVEMHCAGFRNDSIDLNMPVWSPGYYQRLDFANNVLNFEGRSGAGLDAGWRKVDGNTWRVKNSPALTLNYDVKATRSFVGTPFLDSSHGYILPAGVCFYPNNEILHPVTIKVRPYSGWRNVACGLDSIPGRTFEYSAPDFDFLYDCPILIGNLEEFPSFKIKGVPHRFVAYKPGEFDKQAFMDDLKKIIEVATDLIGDIPYKHYTFLGLGPGGGGIEHLTSASVSFHETTQSLAEHRIKTYFFLTHEYFHNYNVKRIRPIELGPFDYDNGSKTKMLWVSEGLSVYYEQMVVRRANLCSEQELLDAFQGNMLGYENKPGRHFQSLAESSYDTWSDGPFGRTGDEVNKTISYYDKGPVVGLLLDFQIRKATGNKKSLDDVMRAVYQEFYIKKKRGFTEGEFRQVCEQVAGMNLAEIFDYVYTTKELDYKKYLSYGGLDIDTASKEIPGGWLGIATRKRNDSVMISGVDWNSPAWNAGLRQRNMILEENGSPAPNQNISIILKEEHPGDSVELLVVQGGIQKDVKVVLGQKKEAPFSITRKPVLDGMQSTILESWQRPVRPDKN